jgi:hypothetical protein
MADRLVLAWSPVLGQARVRPPVLAFATAAVLVWELLWVRQVALLQASERGPAWLPELVSPRLRQ